MRAFISGQAAVAVLFEGDRVRSFELDARPVERERSAVPALFRDSSDVRSVECDSERQLLIELEKAWQNDRSLHLTLLLLDAEEDRDVRKDAAECLEDLLSERAVWEFVANRLYSAPLPKHADLAGAVDLAKAMPSGHLTSFLGDLAAEQGEIAARSKAWLDLPDSLFGTEQERSRFQAAAVDAGAFRLFVTERGKNDRALFQMLVHPMFRGSARARNVLLAWAAPFKESIQHTEFAPDSSEYVDPAGKGALQKAKRLGGFEMYRRVEKQKTAIKDLLLKGDRERALKFTKQLVDSQRKASEREHIAKSLCDLAAFAKHLGDPGLQLELSIWATGEAPEDAWSHGQVGDAYRALGDYDKAMDEFARAGVLGDERVALLGRAQVLKDLGQVGEALAIFEQCAKTFPEDRVSRNGRAAALATFGRFAESLELYDALCKDVPVDPVSWAGRAEVLKDMGRLDQALQELDTVTTMFPGEVIPQCARGEVLREIGRLEEALAWFKQTAKRFPLSIVARNGAAKVLKELGFFDEALEAYRRVTLEFPLDQVAYIGITEVERRRGSLQEAVTGYLSLRERFPRNASIRNGLAAVLAASGRYSDAEFLLPRHPPASRSEWIAYHIRGMIYLRSGELDKAAGIFEHGLAETPWANERSYFQTALASLEVRRKRYKQATDLLKTPGPVSVEPIAALIRMHAHGALGHSDEVRLAYKSTIGARTPLVLSLREDLFAQFERHVTDRPRRTENELFQQECDALLLAA